MSEGATQNSKESYLPRLSSPELILFFSFHLQFYAEHMDICKTLKRPIVIWKYMSLNNWEIGDLLSFPPGLIEIRCGPIRRWIEMKIEGISIYNVLLTGTLNFLRALATFTARCPIMNILATPVRTTYPYSLDSTTIVTLERSQTKQKDGTFG